MKREELYHKSVNVLVQAYFDDTLVAQKCTGCAVGNLVAAANGIKIIKVDGGPIWENGAPRWKYVHCMPGGGENQWFFWAHNYLSESASEVMEEGLQQINATGYSYLETSRIEYAFEKNQIGSTSDEKMFNGLMAVIDVLDEIHENKNSQITKDTKKKFNKEHNLEVSDTTESE